MDQLGSILNTIMEALSSFLPMDEITGALQPVLDTIMKLDHPSCGTLLGKSFCVQTRRRQPAAAFLFLGVIF